MKTNYVLIDYENVQPQDIALLDQEHFRVLVFVGANQGKIAIDLAIALQCMGTRAEYIRVTGNGPNALDFHIAFYIGQFAASVISPCFYIISKDTGFEPLIQHLDGKKIYVRRLESIQQLPSIKHPDDKRIHVHRPETIQRPPPARATLVTPSSKNISETVQQPAPAGAMTAKSPPTKLDVVRSNLQKHNTGRPRTVAALKNAINTLFSKKLSKEELDKLIRELQKQKLITVADTKVSYHFAA